MDSDGEVTEGLFCGHFDSHLSHSEDSNSEDDYDKNQLFRCAAICGKMYEKRKEGVLCDAVIVIEGHTFQAHKIVLMAFSSYFTAMFTSSFSEKNKKQIEIKGVSKEVFEVVLDFMYGAAIDLTFDNVKDIYKAGDMFCIDRLISDCRSYIRDKWRLSNDIEGVYNIANEIGVDDVIADIKNQERSNLSGFGGLKVNSKELSHSFVMTMLEERDLTFEFRSELFVMKNIIKWAFHKAKDRIPDLLLQVLSVVHFEFITEVEFRNALDHDLIQENSNLLIQVNADILSLLKVRLEEMYKISMQKIIDLGFQLVGYDFYNGQLEIHIFNCDTWRWEILSSDSPERPQSCVLSDNVLYLFTSSGGTMLDLQSKLKFALPSFPDRRLCSAFSVIDKTMFLIGGMAEDNKVPFNEILELKPSIKYWQVDTIHLTCIDSSITHGNIIYLVERNHLTKEPLKCFAYNPFTRLLRLVCTLPPSFSTVLLVVHEDVLYIFSEEKINYGLDMCFGTVDLKRENLEVSNVKLLGSRRQLRAAFSIESGILLAHVSDDSKILLSLYNPKHGVPQPLGFVSHPHDKYYTRSPLLFYIPK